MKIPLVLTAHDRFGDSGIKTGSWLQAFDAPYCPSKEASTTIRTGARQC